MEVIAKETSKINKALISSEKEYIESQQQIIQDFFKEYFTYDITNIGYWLVTGIFTFCHVIFLAIPYEDFSKDNFNKNFINGELAPIMVFITTFAVFCYLMPYISCTEKGRAGRIYDKLKYLPVSVKALRKFRFKKMITFVVKVFIVCAVLQIGISLLSFHRVLLGTFIYLGLYGFLLSFLVGLGTVFFTK